MIRSSKAKTPAKSPASLLSAPCREYRGRVVAGERARRCSLVPPRAIVAAHREKRPRRSSFYSTAAHVGYPIASPNWRELVSAPTATWTKAVSQSSAVLWASKLRNSATSPGSMPKSVARSALSAA